MADETLVTLYDGRNIEDLIGFVEEEFPCRYMGVSGTLYAGIEGVAFLGKFFLFDKKLHVKWVDVKVQQSDHGVTMQTRDIKEELAVTHEFTGIHRPERCWSMLVSLHNQALLDRPEGVTASTAGHLEGAAPLGMESATETSRPRTMSAQPIQRRKTLRRMTSDPNKLAPALDALFADMAKEGDILTGENQNDNKNSTNAPPQASIRRVSLQSPKELVSSLGQHTKPTKEELRASLSITLGVVEVGPLAEIEAIVGKIQGRFSCLYLGQQGTLYAGSTALYFAGGRLFFPSRITIQSTNIRQVKMVKGKPKSDLDGDEKAQQDVINESGIVVWARDGDSHTFLGMENPDQVWASLVALRNHVSETGSNSPKSFGMRRMSSDPNLQSHTGCDLLSPTAGPEIAGKGGKPEQELAPPELSEEELQKAWSNIIAKENRYATCVVKDRTLACNLDDFFKTYLGDDAEFSLGKFLTEEGDKEVKSSPWKPTNERGRLVRSRVVSYVHRVNAPMAPPEAKARKEQTYQRLGNLGFIVETKTFVDDVPLTDCFFVKDRLVVQASKPPEEGTKENPVRQLLLSMEFELEFVKSTMFRGIITRTTNNEITDFGEKLITYMATNLGEEVPALIGKLEEEVEMQVAVEEPTLLHNTLGMASVTHVLLVVVIMMQLWVLMEIYSMKSSIRRLETVENQYAYFASYRK